MTSLARTAPVTTAATGTLPGGYRYLRVGDAARPLVVVPGFDDAMTSGRYPRALGPAVATYFWRYLDDHAVYVVSRPRGLPDGYSIAASADGHARALADLGPVDVLGISMGGMIGQQLGVRHPDLVDRLVVASSACRLGESGRERTRRALDRARERDWPTIRAELANAAFADWRRVAYPAFLTTAGRFLPQPVPAVPSDVRVSLEAILDYDGGDDLDGLECPTLVVAGDRDPYFPVEVVRETVERIPGAELALVRGARHGAFHERKVTVDRRTTRFLGAE